MPHPIVFHLLLLAVFLATLRPGSTQVNSYSKFQIHQAQVYQQQLAVSRAAYHRSKYCKLYELAFNDYTGDDPHIRYNLFTRSNRRRACQLRPNSHSIKRCKFNTKAKTQVIIHGWVPKFHGDPPPFVLKDKILGVEDSNVIVLDWTYYANTSYNNSMVRTFYVGFSVAAWLRYLEREAGIDIENVHMTGHSLGSNVAAYASRFVCRTLKRMTFLEPAAFRDLPSQLYPNHADAIFTDAIHTDGGNISFFRTLADIDYFPNGGRMQPACKQGSKFIAGSGQIMKVDSQRNLNLCYHGIALQYYIHSVDKKCQFWGNVCNSYEDYTSGKCASRNPPACKMGFYASQLPGLGFYTKCYLNTTDKSPYCIH